MVVCGFGRSAPALAFTQSVGTDFSFLVPMGHEWITRMAAAEVLGYTQGKAPDVPDPEDPRHSWTPKHGAAWNPKLSTAGARAVAQSIKSHPMNARDDHRYDARYKAVYDAIIGERWVDLGGYGVTSSETCWDAVAQEPADIQYDHFMRRYNDNGGGGGADAAQTSQERFVHYFVTAATAAPMQISTYDGGGRSASVTVDRTYFLFGRAVHEFEDSFSSEHTVRIKDDQFVKLWQVKSYICALGSEQHTHDLGEITKYTSGDVIWEPTLLNHLNPGWSGYKASNMKTVALVSVEATKDLWAAFIRTLGVPADQRAAAAKKEADMLVKNWLDFDRTNMKTWYQDQGHRDDTYVLDRGETGKGQTQTQCMSALKVGTTDQITYVHKLEATQRKCLYNARPQAGFTDQFDPELHTWYSWKWLNGAAPLSDPPADWRIPNQPADTGAIVRIKSLANQKYMIAPSTNNSLIYNRDGDPLRFVMVGPRDRAMFRAADDPLLFLDYAAGRGWAKLYKPIIGEPSSFAIKPAGQGVSIWNAYWKQYFWLDGDEPRLNREGDPKNLNAQWTIDTAP